MLRQIQQALSRYRASNERDNRDIITGWRQRLQDIYIAHYRQQKSAPGTPTHHWQHYAGKK